jgi:hypothetical protein
MSLNPLCGKNLVHWLKMERPLGSGLSTVVTPVWCLSTWLEWSHDHVSLSGCVTLAASNVTGRLTCSTPQQSCVRLATWHITGSHFSTPRCSTLSRVLEGAMLRSLPRHLVRAPTSRSGEHEFESPVRQELGGLTKSGKTLGVRSFYNSSHRLSTQLLWSTSKNAVQLFIGL